MRLKPKSTVHNPRALLYKRFTDLETSIASGRVVLYHTDDGKYWQFSAEMVKFFEYTGDTSAFPAERIVNAGGSASQVYLKFTDIYYVYQITDGVGKWIITRTSGSGGSEAVLSYEDIQENHFFSGQESLNGLNIPSNPFPASVQLTTTSGLENILVLVVTNSLQYALYQKSFPAGEHEAGTYDIPLYQGGDASGNPAIAQYANQVYFSITRDEEYEVDSWDIEITVPTIPAQTLSAKFADIGRYQTNKYYLAGSFDYMIRGSIGSSDTQPIKGNIMHLRSFEIKYFDDSINIDHDDLVVIDGHLYGVEELSYDIKRSPKPYTVYFATLNNIK